MSFLKASDKLKRLVYSFIDSGNKQDYALVDIAYAWRSIVGDLIAEKTFIKKFEKNILFLEVANNVWMQELYLNKAELIQSIKKKTGRNVLDIIFLLGLPKKKRKHG